MSEQGDGTIKNLGIFSTLTSATETSFFLLSATFTLLVDITFLALKQPGLMELARSKETLAASNATFQVILIFIVFSFFTSIILPIAAGIVDEIYWHTVGSWISSLNRSIEEKLGIERTYQNREYHHVTPSELRIEAHRTGEKYYLDLYKEYEKNWHELRKNKIRFAFYSFCCLTMLSIDFYMGQHGFQSIAHSISEYFGGTQVIWALITLLVFMFLGRFYQTNEPQSIYCPNLYDKLKAADKL